MRRAMRSHRLALSLVLFVAAFAARAQTSPFPPFPDTPVNPGYPWPPVILTPNPDFPVLGYGDLFIRDVFHSCQELKDACAGASAADIFDAAVNGWLPVGVCTADELPPDTTHPTASVRLGQTWRPGDHALPWGTGFFQDDPVSVMTPRQRAAQRLRNMCLEGRCCCPILPEEECPNKAPITAWDPSSGACCQYPNRCSLPADWKFEPPFPGSNKDGRCP